MILQFPDSRQSQSFSCGAAATQAVLYYYGYDYREDKIIEALGTSSEEGTPPGAIVRAFLGAGLSVYAGTMTIGRLKRCLDKGYPTVMPIQAWGEDPSDYVQKNNEGHYIVAIGHDGERILFDDPALQSNRGFLTEVELDQRWHDMTKGIVLDHFGIVAMGTPKYRSGQVLAINGARRLIHRWMTGA